MCSMMECVKYSRCQPLCPIHYEVMVADPDVTALTRLGNPTTIRSHHYSCARTACRLNYSRFRLFFSRRQRRLLACYTVGEHTNSKESNPSAVRRAAQIFDVPGVSRSKRKGRELSLSPARVSSSPPGAVWNASRILVG